MKPKLKAAILILIFCVGTCVTALGQGWVNMNFEQATGVPGAPQSFAFLEWRLAAPGWGHSSGGDTGYVYWGTEHLGVSQYYLLMDSLSPTYAPGTHLAGNYSLAFSSGHLTGDPSTAWVNAYISQSGGVPADVRSLEMLAKGPFEVLMNGVSIPMIQSSGMTYVGDISQFAGRYVQLQIVNTATTVHTPTILDNIVFSSVPVPEPASLSLGLLALLLKLWTGRKEFNRR